MQPGILSSLQNKLQNRKQRSLQHGELTEYKPGAKRIQAVSCPDEPLAKKLIDTNKRSRKKNLAASLCCLNHKLRNCELTVINAVINAVVNYRFDVFDLVAPLAPLLSLTTFAAGALTGCRNAACAAASRAIGTRNGLQLT